MTVTLSEPPGHSTGYIGRSHARRVAVQALYQWQLSGGSINEIYTEFLEERDLYKANKEYLRELLYGVVKYVEALDSLIAPILDRQIAELDPVERGIIRLGVYELTHRQDIPYKVIINEAVKLAKTFGAEQGHKYVNSILDKVARQVRCAEVNRSST
jgi:N utilization substance protein B